VIEQLDNFGHVLLMYLADELPAEDRLEVERRLVTDPDLRRQLDQLRLTHETTAEVLSRLDASSAQAALEQAVIRRTGRAIRQWQARPPRQETAREAGDRLRFPWWAYPSAAAASILIALLVLVSHGPTGPTRSGGPTFAEESSLPDEPTTAEAPALSDEGYALLQSSFTDAPAEVDDDAEPIQELARRDLEALQRHDGEGPVDELLPPRMWRE
jgi:hypothetical protein